MIRISFLLFEPDAARAILKYWMGNDHNITRNESDDERGAESLVFTPAETYSPAQTRRVAPACAGSRADLPAAAQAPATRAPQLQYWCAQYRATSNMDSTPAASSHA